MSLPTDRVTPPNELELFLLGKTDSAVGANPIDALEPPRPTARPLGQKPSAGGVDGDSGHIVEK